MDKVDRYLIYTGLFRPKRGFRPTMYRRVGLAWLLILATLGGLGGALVIGLAGKLVS